MPKREITPDYIADHIRRVLKDGGSAPHSEDVQHFFKEEVQSRGWYTAELREFAVRFRRSIVRERGMDFLVQVADRLFSGRILEEKVLAVSCSKNRRGILATMNSSFLPPGSIACRVGPITTRWRIICWLRWWPPTLPAARNFPLGEVAESLAAARGVCGTDPGSARAAVL